MKGKRGAAVRNKGAPFCLHQCREQAMNSDFYALEMFIGILASTISASNNLSNIIILDFYICCVCAYIFMIQNEGAYAH